MTHKIFAGGAAALLTASVALGQGADDCSQAQVVTGFGPFDFDNSVATIDGPMDCTANLTPVRRDVWFLWTAPSSGQFILSTCGLTTLETRVAVYDAGVCPPPAGTNCVEDTCGAQASTPFLAVSGQSYLLRVGSKLVGAGGTGQFEILTDPCGALTDDSLEPNDDCAASTCMTDGPNTALFVNKLAPDWYSFNVAAGATLQADLVFTHANGDIDVYLFDACGGTQIAQSATGTDNESISWQNTTGGNATVVMRVEHWFPDPAGNCTTYDMNVSGSGSCAAQPPIGTTYCQTSPNSAGPGAMISATGSTTVTDQNITLTITGAPNDAPGLFYFGPAQINVPFGQGIRCTGGNEVFRVQPPAVTGPANGNPAGEVSRALDFNAPYAAQLLPGSTVNFQYWYPDLATTNFSNAIEIVLQ